MTPGSLVHLLSGSQHRQLQAVRPVTNKSTQRIQPHKNLARNNKTNHLLLESLVVLEEEDVLEEILEELSELEELKEVVIQVLRKEEAEEIDDQDDKCINVYLFKFYFTFLFLDILYKE